MTVTPRFMIRAALVLTAGGVIGSSARVRATRRLAPPRRRLLRLHRR